jgi:hypothetical protein
MEFPCFALVKWFSACGGSMKSSGNVLKSSWWADFWIALSDCIDALWFFVGTFWIPDSGVLKLHVWCRSLSCLSRNSLITSVAANMPPLCLRCRSSTLAQSASGSFCLWMEDESVGRSQVSPCGVCFCALAPALQRLLVFCPFSQRDWDCFCSNRLALNW